MPYTQLRAVFYDTATDDPFRPAQHNGVSLDDEILIRAHHFVRAASHAHAVIGSSADPADVLTIMLAPEFFFRASTADASPVEGGGHYSMGQVNSAREYLKTHIMYQEKFNNWLIVPGSAVYSQYLTGADVVFNELWAGIGSSMTTYTCQKEYFSNLDGLRLLGPGAVTPALQENSRLRGNAALAHHPIVAIDGRNIGTEICLDHYLGSLKHCLFEPLEGKPPTPPDVQLLVACGMDARPESIAARSNGYVLRCNGQRDDDQKSKVYMIDSWPQTNQPALYTVPAFHALPDLATETLPEACQITGRDGTDSITYSKPLPLPPPMPAV